MVNSVYARAVRNCPWVGQLWGRALRALERSGAPEEQHAALYDKALAAGLQVGVGVDETQIHASSRRVCINRRRCRWYISLPPPPPPPPNGDSQHSGTSTTLAAPPTLPRSCFPAPDHGTS